MGNKIRKIFHSTNVLICAIALIGVILSLVAYCGVTAVSSIVSIYTYVMYAAAALYAVVAVIMIIRTLILFRIIGLVLNLVYMAITVSLFVAYAHFAGIFVLF